MRHVQRPLLTIDVGSRDVRTEDIDDVLERYVGGRGVGTRLAHERIPFDAAPFGPANSVFFATGPLQVSQMSFTGRMSLSGLSPLTDGLLSSNAGGYLSRTFADTGYSAVALTGQSEELLAVHVTDEGVEFEAVPNLSGAQVSDVTAYVESTRGLGPEHLATVSPAGEHMVRFASVMTYDHRAFARGGLGAVLGAKNVKCVTFDGDSRRTVELPAEAMDVHRAAATSDDGKRTWGTPHATEFINDAFSLPTRYFQEQHFDGADAIGRSAVAEAKYKKGTCSVCAFACKLPTRDAETGLETEGPEFETVFSFGSNCVVDDFGAIMKSNDLCDELGMDTVSCGDVIAAYLQANGGFGDVDRIHDLIRKIAYRRGVGDTLAEGIHRFAADLGVEDWTVKGLEFPAHDGRVLHGQALSYAVANRGADHLYSAEMLAKEYGGELDAEGFEDKPAFLVEDENRAAVRDSAVICSFSAGHLDDDQLEALMDADIAELLDVDDRVVTLERHFNNQRGMDRDADRLPYDIPGFEAALDAYYEARGWNEDGTVPAAVVKSLSPAAD
jgi:aldehyde:ferredoxin oxidoreductase